MEADFNALSRASALAFASEGLTSEREVDVANNEVKWRARNAGIMLSLSALALRVDPEAKVESSV